MVVPQPMVLYTVRILETQPPVGPGTAVPCSVPYKVNLPHPARTPPSLAPLLALYTVGLLPPEETAYLPNNLLYTVLYTVPYMVPYKDNPPHNLSPRPTVRVTAAKPLMITASGMTTASPTVSPKVLSKTMATLTRNHAVT